MPTVGTLIVENFSYGVSEAEFELFDDNDEAVLDEEGEQAKAKFKILTLAGEPRLYIEVRVAESEWERFLADLSK